MPDSERKPEGAEPERITLPKGKDGAILLPSVLRDAEGKPRFHLPVPPAFMQDVAIKHLVEREAGFGGFEYPTRAFFDAHLEPGDLFLDVGAHWGVMALSAATRARCEIKVLAIEAHPLNVVRLMDSVVRNGLQAEIETVAAAAGDKPGSAPLLANSTMGHSVRGVGLKGLPERGYPVSVPIVTLDMLMAERPELAERPTIIKIDVEGFEPQVIEGAAELLESGRVKAIVWEKGRAFDTEPGFSEMATMLNRLEALGFRNWVLPHHDLGGPLLPFAPGRGSCNVFALSPDLKPRSTYCRPAGRVPGMSRSNRGSEDPQERRARTESLLLVKGSDGTRWADPEMLREGAEERAALAAKHIAADERIVDLGAGLMRLRRQLPESCTYCPVDLVPFTAETVVLDLNRGDFPSGEADTVVALEVFEYIHALPALLKKIAELVPRLICSYRCHEDGEVETRRQQGWFNDYSEADFGDLLAAAGWAVEQRESGADTRLFVCRKVG